MHFETISREESQILLIFNEMVVFKQKIMHFKINQLQEKFIIGQVISFFGRRMTYLHKMIKVLKNITQKKVRNSIIICENPEFCKICIKMIVYICKETVHLKIICCQKSTYFLKNRELC